MEASVRGPQRVHQAAQGLFRHPGGRTRRRQGPQGEPGRRRRGPVRIDRLGRDHQRVPRADAAVEGGRTGRQGHRSRAVEAVPGRPGQVLHRPLRGVLREGCRAARARRGQAGTARRGTEPAAGVRCPGRQVGAAPPPGAMGADRGGPERRPRAPGVRAAANRGRDPQSGGNPVAPVEPRGAGAGRGRRGAAARDHRPAGEDAGPGARPGRHPSRAHRRGSPDRPPGLARRSRAHPRRI